MGSIFVICKCAPQICSPQRFSPSISPLLSIFPVRSLCALLIRLLFSLQSFGRSLDIDSVEERPPREDHDGLPTFDESEQENQFSDSPLFWRSSLIVSWTKEKEEEEKGENTGEKHDLNDDIQTSYVLDSATLSLKRLFKFHFVMSFG